LIVEARAARARFFSRGAKGGAPAGCRSFAQNSACACRFCLRCGLCRKYLCSPCVHCAAVCYTRDDVNITRRYMAFTDSPVAVCASSVQRFEIEDRMPTRDAAARAPRCARRCRAVLCPVLAAALPACRPYKPRLRGNNRKLNDLPAALYAARAVEWFASVCRLRPRKCPRVDIFEGRGHEFAERYRRPNTRQCR